MYQSTEINELAQALVKAQEEMDTARKGAENPFFKSKYSDLAEVWRAANAVLPKNGLCVTQTTEMVDSSLVLRTKLIHESGQFISGILPISNTQDPQKMGGWITYCRRYGLQAILSMPSEDDDAEGIMDRNKKASTVGVPKGYLEQCTKKLNATTTMEELKKAWDAIKKDSRFTSKQKETLEEVKNENKERIVSKDDIPY